MDQPDDPRPAKPLDPRYQPRARTLKQPLLEGRLQGAASSSLLGGQHATGGRVLDEHSASTHICFTMLGRYLFVPIAIFVGACSTEPNPQDVPGTYAATYQPPLLATATEICDRLFPFAVLSLDQLGAFDLSISLVDDCSRGGGGSTSSQVHMVGQYSIKVARLSFTPETSTAPLFTGTFEGDFVRLNLPPTFGIAIIEVELRVGPRADGRAMGSDLQKVNGP